MNRKYWYYLFGIIWENRIEMRLYFVSENTRFFKMIFLKKNDVDSQYDLPQPMIQSSSGLVSGV